MRGKIAIGLWVLLGCMMGGGLRAQHYVGVRAGYGGGQIRIYPPEDKGLVWGLYSGGVSWKYYSPERYVGGVEMDVEYFQRAFLRKYTYGYQYNEETGENDRVLANYQRYVNSVMVPVIWQPHFYFFQRTMRVFLNFGLTFSYNINSWDEWLDPDGNMANRLNAGGGVLLDPDGNPVTGKATYSMSLTRDNRFSYGLMGGGGLGFLIGRFEIMGEARYYFDYGDVLKNRNLYETNPLRSPMDNINASIGVYYRFGKGGILSPPSKRTAEKMRQAVERRAAAAKPKPSESNHEENEK